MASAPDRSASQNKSRKDAGGPGFLEIYKPGQGRYTRIGTGIGAAILILAGAKFAYDELIGSAFWLQMAIPMLIIVGFGLLTFWLVGSFRPSADFMIATEGEMKKVNWSSKREVWGSTKVVIITVILLSLIIFVVDIGFIFLFSAIGVLKTNILKRLFTPEV